MARNNISFVHEAVVEKVGAWCKALGRMCGDRAYIAGAVILALIIFSPLASQRGLYELGDANFPWRPFPLDYFLPWQERVSAGVDNVFIGVPRLAYYASINLVLVVFRNAQVAQWVWYSAVCSLGIIGAYRLAARLGAGALSFPLALFYACNLWSYDRVAQAPLFMAYEAAPLALYLLLRCMDKQRIIDYLAFALSVILIVPALQMAYLLFVLCAAIIVYFLVQNRFTLRGTLALVGVVVAANGFFVFPMVADLLGRDSNAIGLVSQRFPASVFIGYAARATFLDTLRLASFFYSSFDRQPAFFQWTTLLAPLLLLFCANALAAWRRPAFRASVLLLAGGIWLVAGLHLAPAAYEFFRKTAPGLKLFVEPDYFTPLVILGMFAVLASACTAALHSYKRWWVPAVWLLGCVGVFPFLPLAGPHAGLPQTLIPAPYVRFQQSDVSGRTLWLPNLWVAQYRWSPYLMNGFTVLNSPSDAIGPQMLEWTPPDSLKLIDQLVSDFQSGRARRAAPLMQALSIGAVAIAADQLSSDGTRPNRLVQRAQTTLHALEVQGAISSIQHLTEPYANLIVAKTGSRLPVIGLYGTPLLAHASPSAVAMLLTDQQRNGRYHPLRTDGSRPPLDSDFKKLYPCDARVEPVHRIASVFYTVEAVMRGHCALIFRDSFAPDWRAVVSMGQGNVNDHFEADGYANGWIVSGDGRLTLSIYHALAIPYTLGLLLTVFGLTAFIIIGAQENRRRVR